MPKSLNNFYRFAVAFPSGDNSAHNDKLTENLTSDQYEGIIAKLEKDKSTAFQQLQNEKQQSKQKGVLIKVLIGIIEFLVLAGMVIFVSIARKKKIEMQLRKTTEKELQALKAESEKEKAALLQQKTEMEMQALRAQMNPHFIFNSLSSINHFILQNNKLKASEYLARFSRLIRLVLQNSQSATIPLDRELNVLELYLELETLRFDHRFDYKISVEEDLDTSAIMIPPLLLQPYVENAVWHGLMHKEEKGFLSVELSEKNDQLFCTITDDGIGRKKAAELKKKSSCTHKSFGMRITADRISLMQQNKQSRNLIRINDLALPDGTPGGTEVLIKIPVQYA